MSFRDTVQEWIDKGFTPRAKNPLLSKRLVLKNLNQILNSVRRRFTVYRQGKNQIS